MSEQREVYCGVDVTGMREVAEELVRRGIVSDSSGVLSSPDGAKERADRLRFALRPLLGAVRSDRRKV